jgi:hypothetical protein
MNHKKRLSQFRNFGHNCAVLGFKINELDTILEDNRFNPWAITDAEKDAFLEGFEVRPLQWDRQTLKPIDIRPIVHEATKYNDPEMRRPSRGVLPGQLFSQERKTIASDRAKKFWNSPRGMLLRERQSERLKKTASTRNEVAYINKR